MAWWAWLVLGIGLLGVEMFVIDAQFYLVFIGLSAAVVGAARPRRNRAARPGRNG